MSLSRFTPSNADPALLELLFVAREDLLEAVMSRVRAAADSDQRNHTMLVGPRGAGKTHLVALAHSRTQAMHDQGAHVQTSWPVEDLYWVTSYEDFLAEIARALDPALDDELPRGWEALEGLLSVSAQRNGVIVTFVENFDQLLEAMGELGQQRLRRFLQDDAAMLLVATTTSVTRHLADQAVPFYGFFTTSRLEPLEIDDAVEMLSRIAAHRGEHDLVEYLASPQGRNRVRTVAHLAGGQPRIWATLASALTVAGLDDLIEVLLTEFDTLTPYYQEQLSRLSPQQRRVVNELIRADMPLHVAEIASRLDADQRSIAKTMTELRDRNWTAPTTSPLLALVDRRRTYYELAEPLARLALQIKAARNTPIALVVEFCKTWFDPDTLTAATSDENSMYVEAIVSAYGGDQVLCLVRQLNRLPATAVPTVELLGDVDDALDALAEGDPDPALGLHVALRTALETQLEHDPEMGIDMSSLTELRQQINDAARRQFGRVPHPDMARWIERTEALLVHSTIDQRRVNRERLADWNGRNWQFDTARSILDLSEGSSENPDTLRAWASLAASYWSAGRTPEAIELQERVLTDRERILGDEHPDTLTARNNLAASYRSAGRTHDAIEIEERVAADTPATQAGMK
jgi:tetratricopeptide (TPR) repeat protein